MGKMVEVEITECGKHSMKCKVLNDHPIYPIRSAQYKQGEITGYAETMTNKDSNNNVDDHSDAESSCCGGEGHSCHQDNQDKYCCSLENTSKLNHQIDNNNKWQTYAYATLVTAGIILTSRIVLRFVNANK